MTIRFAERDAVVRTLPGSPTAFFVRRFGVALLSPLGSGSGRRLTLERRRGQHHADHAAQRPKEGLAGLVADSARSQPQSTGAAQPVKFRHRSNCAAASGRPFARAVCKTVSSSHLFHLQSSAVTSPHIAGPGGLWKPGRRRFTLYGSRPVEPGENGIRRLPQDVAAGGV